MTNTNWVNHGDENPLEHGGIWVKQDNETSFYIVKNELIDNNEDTQQVLDLYVDTSDSWIDKTGVLSCISMSEDNFDIIQYAIGATDYYSYENFGTKTNYNSKEEVKSALQEFGISIGNDADV